MSQDSGKVIVPGNGRFWKGSVDALPPGQLYAVTGTPTQVTQKFTVNAVQSANVVLKSTDSVQTKMLAIAQGIAALSTVGAGNVVVLPGVDVWSFVILIMPEVTSPAVTVDAGTFTGGTAPAASITVPGASNRGQFTDFAEIGHTSKDNPLQMNRTGGDVTTLDSWQQAGIDASHSAVTWSMAYSLLQYDVQSMRLYHGSNALQLADGSIGTNPAGPTATEHGLFLLIRNGQKAQARHYPRVSTIAADGENFDTSKLADMPVQSALLTSNTLSYGQSISQTGVAA